MFTGIIEELGRIVSNDHGRLVIDAALAGDLAAGESVAVSGCCLTVVEVGPGWWSADVVPETLASTTLAEREPGDLVNLERAARLGDRLGGHLVQGHVDAAGTVVHPPPDLVVSLPERLSRYVVEKGSISLDGVSLTVVEVEHDRVRVALTPSTTAATTLGGLLPGDRLNVEVDVLAKYVERLMAGPERMAG